MSTRILKLWRIWIRIRKILASWRGKQDKIYFGHRVDQYRSIWSQVAKECHASFRELADDMWEIERDGTHVRVLNHQIQLDDPVTLELAGRKPQMHRMLKGANLCVPDFVVFPLSELDKAYEFLRKYPKGCVVKPANGSAAGDGVTTHVISEKEIRRAAVLASLYDSSIMIEPQIPGECYRILVLGGEMVHAVCRRGPRLVGNGKSKVRELIDEENQRRAKSSERRITVDRDCHFTLDWQGLSLSDVPEQDRKFIVKTVNDERESLVEIRTVYNADVTAEMCPSIRETAERAAQVLGSDFVGVDLILTDPSRPLRDTGGIINEVNTTPALHHHYDSTREPYPAPAIRTLEIAFSRLKAHPQPPPKE
jgi:cyanophycin synthetase